MHVYCNHVRFVSSSTQFSFVFSKAQLYFNDLIMAENMSLLSLEDDLTCSICLGLFENPVSLICGHSFCANCLEATWNDRTTSMFCPHCRMLFSSKPELKKNTVLSAVVDAYRVKAGISEPVTEVVEVKSKDPEQIRCDTCMEAEAVKTCLTCMASYCEDHVRPHRENAIFRAHQLCDPLPDLMERLCPDHSKLVEFFCTQHQCCICSTCLQFEHKGCEFTSSDEQRHKQKVCSCSGRNHKKHSLTTDYRQSV